MSPELSPGLSQNYQLIPGDRRDRALLVKFMQRTYEELFPGLEFNHLATTVEQFLSPNTPLWWMVQSETQAKVACLWLGNSIDQVRGDRNTYIFLLFVDPNHRRQGLGTALMAEAERWTKQRGDRQLTLQVFQHNAAALKLYEKLGFQPQSIWLAKEL